MDRPTIGSRPARPGVDLGLRVAVVLACLAGTGCSTAAPGSSGSAPATTSVGSATGPTADDQPGEVHGELLQFRRDVERRRLEVRLVAAEAGLVVEELELRAPGLTIEEAPEGETVLRPAPGLDLPVTMGPADCAVRPGPAVVSLRLRDDTGARRTVDVPLEDDGLVRRLHDQDCAEQALMSQADIAVVGSTPVRTDRGPAVRISVELRRLAGDDPVRVTGTGSNTVYDITAVGALPTLREAPVRLQLDMVPARCDVHALGESYRTGLIGLVVAVGQGAPRPHVLTPAADVRRDLEAFAVATCRAG